MEVQRNQRHAALIRFQFIIHVAQNQIFCIAILTMPAQNPGADQVGLPVACRIIEGSGGRPRSLGISFTLLNQRHVSHAAGEHIVLSKMALTNFRQTFKGSYRILITAKLLLRSGDVVPVRRIAFHKSLRPRQHPKPTLRILLFQRLRQLIQILIAQQPFVGNLILSAELPETIQKRRRSRHQSRELSLLDLPKIRVTFDLS